MPDTIPSNNPPESAFCPTRRKAIGFAFAALFLLAAVPLIHSGIMGGRGGYDQVNFHEPAVRGFARQLPTPDLRDYPSATTPGYHLALALFARLIDDHRATLQLAGALFTAALFALLAHAVLGRSRHPPPITLALLLPALASLYLFVPGVWLQPDNAGWLGVVTVLLLSLRHPFTRSTALLAGLALLALVFTRQIHLWAAAPIWTAAWLAAAPAHDQPLSTLFANPRRRLSLTLFALVCTLPAFFLLAGLTRLWGGLTPPSFHDQHNAGFNPATPAFAMSLLAIFSTFFGAFLWQPFRRLLHSPAGRAIVLTATLTGLLLAALPPTTYLWEQRGSGLWNLVRAMDQRGLTIAGRTSPLLLVLSPLGAVALVTWLAASPPRERWIWLTAALAFLAAQSANSNAWQRYIEPFWLMVLPLLAARIDHAEIPRPLRRLALAGPLLLAALLAIITSLSIRAALRGVQPTPPTLPAPHATVAAGPHIAP